MKENNKLLNELAEREYTLNSDVYREAMAEELGGEAWAFEKEEVLDFIAEKYADESVEDLRKALR